jgi:hypothetical protein
VRGTLNCPADRGNASNAARRAKLGSFPANADALGSRRGGETSPEMAAWMQPGQSMPSSPNLSTVETQHDCPVLGRLAAEHSHRVGRHPKTVVVVLVEHGTAWLRMATHAQRECGSVQPGHQAVGISAAPALKPFTGRGGRLESLGARQAWWQPQQGVRVMIDPVGHIFDLFVEGS